jgi:hypothetical protein
LLWYGGDLSAMHGLHLYWFPILIVLVSNARFVYIYICNVSRMRALEQVDLDLCYRFLVPWLIHIDL